MGALHYRCALPGFEETVGHPGEPGAAAAAAMLADAARRMLRGGGGGSGGGAVAGGGSQSEWDTGVFCKVGDAASCADLEGASCAYFDDNPNSGLLSFDSVAWAFVNILQVRAFLTHLLTYSLTHILTYSLTHLLTYSLTHLLANLLSRRR